jgi:hypothetical protein
MTHDFSFFVRESNRIESINRDPLPAEIAAHEKLLTYSEPLSIAHLVEFVSVIQPDATLRDRPGLDVYVGGHKPIAGGPSVVQRLEHLLTHVNTGWTSPFSTHCSYENLHPFTDGNGRSGRALWLWQMQRAGGLGAALEMGFLRLFYYQTLARMDRL